MKLTDTAREVVLISRLEHPEARVVEVRLDRARARNNRRLAHGDEVEHLVAVREVAKRIAAGRDHAHVGIRDCLHELVDRRPSPGDVNAVAKSKRIDERVDIAGRGSFAVHGQP